MAFNFNWSPLMADASFYTRAQGLLTAALNKSPKPPIIVDDIIVTELNLGSIPPDLEILEIGDLAEDRFRGIFKMSYAGDAFLTLKTRVQANPLNTYLVTRPAFASPKPLAAAAGLTIPLQITLSNFCLSGFIVLVFSKQKGITVVFRNDPLESLKVSSTFDSIPFVRDYLQKEIEGQLRVLFMDELPAIIHRLSLRLWVPEYDGRAAGAAIAFEKAATDEPGQDPLTSPPKDPVDASGNALNASQIAALSLDSGVEIHSLFSQKSLLRLATLTDSQRTLSLFTPSIGEVVYRAWSGHADQSDGSATLSSPISPALSRTQSHVGSLNAILDNASSTSTYSRATSSVHNFVGTGANRHSKAHSRKRKKRVVDLRRSKTTDDVESVSGESSYSESTTPTVFSSPAEISEERNDDPVTPPLTPQRTIRLPPIPERRRLSTITYQRPPRSIPADYTLDNAATSSSSIRDADPDATPRSSMSRIAAHTQRIENGEVGSTPASNPAQPSSILSFNEVQPQPSKLDAAWVLKMANEIARQMQEDKASASSQYKHYWPDHGHGEMPPPPAYGP